MILLPRLFDWYRFNVAGASRSTSRRGIALLQNSSNFWSHFHRVRRHHPLIRSTSVGLRRRLTLQVPLTGSSDWSSLGRLRTPGYVGSSTAARRGTYTAL